MHELYSLKEKMLDELKKYAGKEMSASTLETVDKLAHATKNLCKVIDDMEGYSERGGNYAMNRGGSYAMGGSYDDGRMYGSYDDGMMRYSEARGRTGNVRRDSMGRYSRDGGTLAMELRELMREAPEGARGEFEKLITKVERM